MSDREIILGTSVSPIFDLRVGETQHEVDTILKIIEDYEICAVVEVGVHEGGLTEYLLNNTSCNYLGIEINPSIPSSEIIELLRVTGRGNILFGDCFSPTTLLAVREFLYGNVGRCLIYCDGGNKKAEIKVYSKSIKLGDILLTHDFYDGARKIREIDDYRTWEVGIEDIQFIDSDPNFTRLPENILMETRLIGWTKP